MDAMTQTALFLAMQKGQQAKAAAGTVAGALDELDKRTVEEILSKLDRGEAVSGEAALMAWQQMLANRRLRRHLEHREREGIAAAVAVKPVMDMEEK